MKIYVIILMVLFSVSIDVHGSEKRIVAFKSDTLLEFVIEGFNGFESFIIKQLIIDSTSLVEVSTNYQGFALLKFNTGQQYPLIISDSILHVNVHEPNIPPDFENSPENEFLYKWLSKHLKQQTETLTNPEYKYANIILKARLLNESTYGIKTLEELNGKRERYHQFINENYEILQHSDMLIQLAAQYFMMHEYVSHVKGDISQTKIHYRNAVVVSVGDWIKVLQNRIPKTIVTEFCAKLYYNRSMVTMASYIFDHYREDININQTIWKTEEQLPDFEFVNAKRLNKQNSSDLRANKIIAIINSNSVFSKVETIAFARDLIDNKLDIPIIIAPVEELSESHIIMDKMFTGDFYFIDDKMWLEKYLKEEINLPQFILLDKNNQIIKISNYRDTLFK